MMELNHPQLLIILSYNINNFTFFVDVAINNHCTTLLLTCIIELNKNLVYLDR